jgi:hypothetical protein
VGVLRGYYLAEGEEDAFEESAGFVEGFFDGIIEMVI